jgi:hypothetical protein
MELITMERPEIQFKGIDERTYITLPFGALIGMRLSDLQLVCQFHYFRPDDAKSKSSKFDMSLCGIGDLRDQKIAVAGVEGTTVSKLPVNINVWDDVDIGKAWKARGFEGWPVSVGAFKAENEKEYAWSVEVYIAQQMFDELLQRYHRKTLASLYLSVYTDLMIDEGDRWSPGGRRNFFLVYENGRTDFPTNAIGEVDGITFTEPKSTFAPPERQEPSQQFEEGLEQIAALKDRIHAIEQSLLTKPKGWLR